MKSYGQYCPIARTSEILAERWTPLIVRNMMFGLDTFADLHRGVPAMSRSMLIKRLGQLERANVITKTEKANGHGHRYRLTEAGKDLGSVIAHMAEWGDKWVEITAEHCDPSVALWAWAKAQMRTDDLPTDRTVVAFVFPEQPPTNRYYWLLFEGGGCEMCFSDPGDRPAVTVTAENMAFIQWHYGQLDWDQALRDGFIQATGDRELARQIPTWNTHMPLMLI